MIVRDFGINQLLRFGENHQVSNYKANTYPNPKKQSLSKVPFRLSRVRLSSDCG